MGVERDAPTLDLTRIWRRGSRFFFCPMTVNGIGLAWPPPVWAAPITSRTGPGTLRIPALVGKYGRWTRERSQSGLCDTYTTPDGERYECWQLDDGDSWSVVQTSTGPGSAVRGLPTLREARRWIICHVVSRTC
jgi:hypothetical protein